MVIRLIVIWQALFPLKIHADADQQLEHPAPYIYTKLPLQEALEGQFRVEKTIAS